MPKTRQRVTQPGAKSVALKIKHKIGGRKSFTGIKQTSTSEIEQLLTTVRKRDRNKLRRVLEDRERTVLPAAKLSDHFSLEQLENAIRHKLPS